MTSRVGKHSVVELAATEREDQWNRCVDVLHHDVEVQLLRDVVGGPGRALMVWCELERQSRAMVIGGHDDPVVTVIRDWLIKQPRIELSELPGSWTVKDDMMQAADHFPRMLALPAKRSSSRCSSSVRLAKRTSNLFRPRSRSRGGLAVDGLDGVIAVDAASCTADSAGHVTSERPALRLW